MHAHAPCLISRALVLRRKTALAWTVPSRSASTGWRATTSRPTCSSCRRRQASLACPPSTLRKHRTLHAHPHTRSDRDGSRSFQAVGCSSPHPFWRAQLLLYLALGPDEKLKYVEGGERAVTRFEEGVKGLEAKAYRGLGIFQSQPYDQNDESQALQLLQRSTQVGEFYRMMPPETWSKEYILPPAYMDIIIFDEEADKHTHITFEQAIHACCLSMEQGNPLFWKKIMFGGATKYEKVKTEMADIMLKHYSTSKEADKTDPTVVALNAWVRAEGTPSPENEFKAVIKCITKGVYMPVCIVIARPFIEHLTMSCIMAVSGSSTGATLFGPADSAPPS